MRRQILGDFIIKHARKSFLIIFAVLNLAQNLAVAAKVLNQFQFPVAKQGAGEESWSIDYVRLYGDLSHQGIWDALADMLHKTYTPQDGTKMNVAQVCIDSGGHYTDEVYAFCRKQGADWAITVKGSSQAGKPIATLPKTKNKKGVYLTLVGTDIAKELIYQGYRY